MCLCTYTTVTYIPILYKFNLVAYTLDSKLFTFSHCTQAQYVFLHDAIMEGITSGATEVRVEKLGQKYAELEQTDAEGETGFQKEYGVRHL